MQNHEFSFKEYLIALLRRADLLVLFAVVFAILLGSLSYFKYVNNSDSIQAAYEKRLERYEEELNTKLSQSEYHRNVAAAAEMYNEQSLLMQIDPYNKQVATLNMSIGLEPNLDEQSTERTVAEYVSLRDYFVRRVVNRYLVLANSANLGDILKDVLPRSYDESFLREIVSIKTYAQTSANPVEMSADQGILSITVFGTADINAKQVVDTIKAYLESRKPLVAAAVQAHELMVLDENSYSTVDNELVQFQAQQRNLVSESKQKAINLLKEADGLRGNRPQKESLLAGVIKNALVGAVLGCAFGILVLALACRLRVPLQYVQQLQELMGLGFLGGLKSKRRSLLSPLIRRISGEQELSDDQEARRIIAANVESATQGLKKVLLTGSVPDAELKTLADGIVSSMREQGLELVYGSNINLHADTVRKMSEADAVIFVERLQQTRLGEVVRQKQRIELSNKPILGYILC